MEEKEYTYTMPRQFMEDDEVPLRWRAYALLTGFWISGKSVYATNEWLEKQLNCSRRGIQVALSELEELGLAERDIVGKNRLIVPGGRSRLRGGAQTSDVQGRRRLPHSSDSISDNIKGAETIEDSGSASSSEDSGDDLSIVTTDEEGNELTYRGLRRERPTAPPKNKVALGLVAEFKGMVLKEIGIQATVGVEGYVRVLAAMSAGLTSENIRLLFEDWFASRGKDEDKTSITRALSNIAINRFKVREGLV